MLVTKEESPLLDYTSKAFKKEQLKLFIEDDSESLKMYKKRKKVKTIQQVLFVAFAGTVVAAFATMNEEDNGDGGNVTSKILMPVMGGAFVLFAGSLCVYRKSMLNIINLYNLNKSLSE